MTKNLEGKTALVTGGTRNLGRGIAERLAASGALVAVNYAGNVAAAHDIIAMIESKGGRAFPIQEALGPTGSAEALAAGLAKELVKRTGSPELDILINNVGGSDGPASIEDTTPEVFDALISRNLRVPFFVTRALLPHLRQGGRIINLSSAASRLAVQNYVVYSMCKAGIDVFTRAMAKELGSRGITVNAVLPGYNITDTNAGDMDDPILRKQVEDATLLGRFGFPADIAEVVHALAGPSMGWVTGQLIEASGGFSV